MCYLMQAYSFQLVNWTYVFLISILYSPCISPNHNDTPALFCLNYSARYVIHDCLLTNTTLHLVHVCNIFLIFTPFLYLCLNIALVSFSKHFGAAWNAVAKYSSSTSISSCLKIITTIFHTWGSDFWNYNWSRDNWKTDIR